MLLALVDCNNFFVSCERVCNPKLEKKPVVVLSSNDGCVIARSQEAKRLGIPMGAPAFQCDVLFKKYGVVVLSSNFALYLDMSWRVMRMLQSYTPLLQVYSIDEAFLSFEGVQDPVAYAKEMRDKILRWTGIPVSIGIGATKVLTKVASHVAKKEGGICLLDETNRASILEKLPVDEIWGIGAKLSERLRKKGVYTAWQLQAMPDSLLQKELSVIGLRLALELRGVSCLDVEPEAAPKKSISTAKSFERPVKTLDELGARLAGYVDEVAKDLRAQESLASFLVVSLPDAMHESYKEAYCTLAAPTQYTPTLITCAKKALEKLFQPGISYKKVGVMLGGFIPKQQLPQDLFSPACMQGCIQEKEERLMQVYDSVNERYGKNSISFAAKKERVSRSSNRTPRYTTRWDELICVR